MACLHLVGIISNMTYVLNKISSVAWANFAKCVNMKTFCVHNLLHSSFNHTHADKCFIISVCVPCFHLQIHTITPYVSSLFLEFRVSSLYVVKNHRNVLSNNNYIFCFH